MNDFQYPDDELPMSKRDRMWNGIAPHLPQRVRDGRVLDAQESHLLLCAMFDAPSYEERCAHDRAVSLRESRARLYDAIGTLCAVALCVAIGVGVWG